MSHDQTDVPSELIDVKEALAQCEIDRPHMMARRFLEDSLLRATTKLLKTPDPHVHNFLATQWLAQFEYYIAKGGVSELLTKELDAFMQYAAHNKQVVITAQAMDGGKLLACVCLARIHLRACGFVHAKSYNVGDVLKHLTGEPASDLELRSMETAVTKLYGSACWSLYRDDVVDDSKLPEYLWRLNVPLAKDYKLACDNHTGAPLPNDM